MSMGELRGPGSLSATQAEELDRACDRFEAAWRAGERPDLAAYLAKYQTGLSVRDVAAQIASPDVKGIFDTFIVGDKAIPEAVYREAIEQHRPKLQRLYAATFAKYRLDALIFPTTPLPAEAPPASCA